MISGEYQYFRLTKEQYEMIRFKRGARFLIKEINELTSEKKSLLKENLSLRKMCSELKFMYKKTYNFKVKIFLSEMKCALRETLSKLSCFVKSWMGV